MELLQSRVSPGKELLDKKLASAPLFACTKCMKKFPFASLSEDKQCCPDCRAASINVKCIYCQAEFEGNGNSSLCKHCHKNEKHFGKPKACEWCNMLSAFNKSSICARCKHYSQKYGNPVSCERCKRECAFDRKEEIAKTGNKILCWTCIQAFRRKKSGKDDINGNRKRPSLMMDSSFSLASTGISSSNKSSKTSENNTGATAITELHSHSSKSHSHETTPEYTFSNRTNHREGGVGVSVGATGSDSFMLISELRDKVSLLEKKLSSKEIDLAAKDKQIAELKTDISVNEQQFRTRIQGLQRVNSEYVEQMATKSREITQLQKQLNNLKKEKKEK